MQKVCSPACAMKVARQVVDKAEKKEIKLKLDAMQTKPQLVKKAQTAFQRLHQGERCGKALHKL
jgi:hypothetical protein